MDTDGWERQAPLTPSCVRPVAFLPLTALSPAGGGGDGCRIHPSPASAAVRLSLMPWDVPPSDAPSSTQTVTPSWSSWSFRSGPRSEFTLQNIKQNPELGSVKDLSTSLWRRGCQTLSRSGQRSHEIIHRVGAHLPRAGLGRECQQD